MIESLIKIGGFIILFVAGLIILIFGYSSFFEILKLLYVLTSGNRIEFFGKHFAFPSTFTIILFSFSFALISFQLIYHIQKKYLGVLIWLFTFWLSVIVCTTVHSFLIYASHDAEIRLVHLRHIGTDTILKISSIASIFPSLFLAVKNK